MDILRLFPGRMKVTLSKEELTREKLDFRAEESAPGALDRFLLLIARATGEVFRREDCRICVFPDGAGGCEIYLSGRISSPALAAAGARAVLPEKAGPEGDAIADLPAPGRGSEGKYICGFDELTGALAVRRALEALGEETALFREDGAERYLLVSTAGSGDMLFLEEFGRKLTVDPLPYLSEHFLEI